MTAATNTFVPGLDGLSAAEVQQRIELGQVNDVPHGTSRTVGEIIRANVFTRFNMLLGILVVVVLFVAPIQDALFGFVLVANTSIGIVQEVRAKRTLDRVRLLVTPVVTVRPTRICRRNTRRRSVTSSLARTSRCGRSRC